MGHGSACCISTWKRAAFVFPTLRAGKYQHFICCFQAIPLYHRISFTSVPRNRAAAPAVRGLWQHLNHRYHDSRQRLPPVQHCKSLPIQRTERSTAQSVYPSQIAEGRRRTLYRFRRPALRCASAILLSARKNPAGYCLSVSRGLSA